MATSTPSLGNTNEFFLLSSGGAVVFPAALEEVVRLRTTDLVGGGVMLRALMTLLFAFVYTHARSGPAVTVLLKS